MAPLIEATPEIMEWSRRSAPPCRSPGSSAASRGARSSAYFAVSLRSSSPVMARWSSTPTSIRINNHTGRITGLSVSSLTSAVYTVKILAVGLDALRLDAVIDLMRCFPYLERLYIECVGRGKKNFWRCKHQEFIRSSDIHLKRISWRYYQGIKSHVDFATFFVLNARVLELMTLEVNKEDYNEEFFAQQRKMLQLDSKASRGAQLRFTTDPSHRYILDFGVRCLDLADPFEWKYPSEFYALS